MTEGEQAAPVCGSCASIDEGRVQHNQYQGSRVRYLYSKYDATISSLQYDDMCTKKWTKNKKTT